MSEENGIVENGSWDEDFNQEKKQNQEQSEQRRLEWMKFDKPGDYVVRLCGKFVKFHRWWSPFTTRVITHLSYKDQDPAWNAGFWPRKTFAIHVIDRNDCDEEHPTGKLKILEKGSSIFERFANYKRINDVDPASKDGPEFVITVTWPGGNKRRAEYSVEARNRPAPWTKEEVAMIKKEHVTLQKLYAPTPLEKIQELWDALPDEAKIPPKRDDDEDEGSSPSPAPAPTPIKETPPKEVVPTTDDDDLFGDDDDSTGF